MQDLNRETQGKENNEEIIGQAIDGSEITKGYGLEDYFHQICSVIAFLGEATKAKIGEIDSPGYTVDADFGHYLVFGMAIRELKKFGELVGVGMDPKNTEKKEVQDDSNNL